MINPIATNGSATTSRATAIPAKPNIAIVIGGARHTTVTTSSQLRVLILILIVLVFAVIYYCYTIL